LEPALKKGGAGLSSELGRFFLIGSRGTDPPAFSSIYVFLCRSTRRRGWPKIAIGTGSSTKNGRDGTGENGQTRRSLKLAARLRRRAWRFGSASAELSQIVGFLPPISKRLIRSRSPSPHSAKTYGNLRHRIACRKTCDFPGRAGVALIGRFSPYAENA